MACPGNLAVPILAVELECVRPGANCTVNIRE
jgi:hypothetical protein